MANDNEILKQEALRILKATEEQGIPVRLLGGMAIYLSSPCTKEVPFSREINDLDFVVSKKKATAYKKLLVKIGYEGDHEFNSVHGESRLLFYSDQIELDIFVGVFEQCHGIKLDEYISSSSQIIPLAILLLTKLQIVKINIKDILDILALLHDHAIQNDGNPNEIISLIAINSIISNDWGWYTTCLDNLDEISSYVRENFIDFEKNILLEKIDQIRTSAQNSTKSLKWKIRSTVGRKVQWYELPEEKK
jgi:hypothetical protein